MHIKSEAEQGDDDFLSLQLEVNGWLGKPTHEFG